MRLVRVLLPLSLAAGLLAQTPAWDTSGNGMLNGTYYFRGVTYLLSGTGDGSLSDLVVLYGNVRFDGAGNYTMYNAALGEYASGQLQQNGTVSGTYAIAASGQGFLSNPLFKGDLFYGGVNAQGIFVGSSTENLNGYNDLFIAAPLTNPQQSLSTFKGSYTLAYMDPGLSPISTFGGMLQMSPDGAGNVGTVGVSGYLGQSGSSKAVQSLSNVTYTFSGGAAVVKFPNSNTALFAGQYYLYFSPDGNFVFGGSPTGFDMFVGVRTGTGTPNLSGLYYQAGLDQDESNLNTGGFADLDSYYGAFSAGGGAIVGHQRLLDLFNPSAASYTYSDSYTVPSNGAYTSGSVNYVVGGGIRVGSGIGPFLGISVALQAPAMNSSLSPSGVFLNPTGIVNAGSSAPFTAGIAPGELLTLYGSNLASGTEVASSVPFPVTLGKVQVTVNNIQAPIYYVTPTQLSAVVPYGVTGSIANVQVINNGVASNTVATLIGKTAPGVLTQLQNGLGYGDVLHLDGTPVNAKSPAQIGETVSVYVTGLGAVNPAIGDGAAGPVNPLSQSTNTIAAFIGGVKATVGYAGLAPQLAGLYQINLTVPAGLTAGDHNLDIAGPDAYSSECLIAIAGAPSAAPATVPLERRTPHGLSRRGATVPTSR